MVSVWKMPIRASPSRFLISNLIIAYLNITKFLTDNRFPAGIAGNNKLTVRVTLYKHFNPSASFPYHGIVPLGNFTRADGKCFFEFFWIRAKRWFEEQGIVKFVTHATIKCNKNILSELKAGEHLLVPEYFCAVAALISTVEEPAFGDPVIFFQGFGSLQERPIASEELRMSPASFIHQFPECPVKNCLTNP